MNKNTKLLICAVVGLLLLGGCGKLVPSQINVGVSGTVGIAGMIDVNVEESSLESFFAQQCANNLGPNATQQQIQTCETNELNGFLTLVGLPSPSPSPSPSPT